MQKSHRLAWVAVGVLATLCAGLAVLQYRWISEITGAERTRLHEELQSRLDELARAFNGAVSAACFDLVPPTDEIDQLGAEGAYSAQYLLWRNTHDRVLQQAGIAIPHDGELR